MTAKIELTGKKGLFALVDAEDFELLQSFTWYAQPTGKRGELYVMTRIRISGSRKHLGIHRVIMRAAKGQDVDHINGDRFDNRKGNLRLCSHAENCRNRRHDGKNRSGFKGVGRKKHYWKYYARIKYDGRLIALGYYGTAEEAARVYDAKAIELFGEFARLNFPPDAANVGNNNEPVNIMTTANKSRVDQAKQTLISLRDERASASPDDQKQAAFVENKKQLDAAIKALDAIKATGG